MEFTRENVVKLFTDLDALFADVIEQAANEANFAEEAKAEEEKLVEVLTWYMDWGAYQDRLPDSALDRKPQLLPCLDFYLRIS